MSQRLRSSGFAIAGLASACLLVGIHTAASTAGASPGLPQPAPTESRTPSATSTGSRPTATPSLTPTAKVALTLIASERTVIAGRPVTLTGQITSDDPSCVARQRVMIERRAHGSTTVNQMDLGESDADGSFSRSLQVQASADYSAWVRRHDACPEARSGTTPVFVRVQVNVTAPTSVARATRLTIAGAVQPAHPEGHVELQRRKDGEWSVVGRRTLDSASKFAFDMPARWTGRRTFRVRCNPGDEDHKGAVSARVRISTTEPRTR